jgi:hypothetical protein
MRRRGAAPAKIDNVLEAVVRPVRQSHEAICVLLATAQLMAQRVAFSAHEKSSKGVS